MFIFQPRDLKFDQKKPYSKNFIIDSNSQINLNNKLFHIIKMNQSYFKTKFIIAKGKHTILIGEWYWQKHTIRAIGRNLLPSWAVLLHIQINTGTLVLSHIYLGTHY